MVVGSVSAHEGVTPPRQATGGQMPDSQSLSEMFLQLLLKELTYQNPLNPIDGADFITQLAQLSVLEQMREMNTTLQTVRERQQAIQANALIGRHVRATESDGSVIEGRVMAVHLDDEAITLDVEGQYTIPMDAVSEISGAPAEEMLGAQLATWLFNTTATLADFGPWFNPYRTEV